MTDITVPRATLQELVDLFDSLNVPGFAGAMTNLRYLLLDAPSEPQVQEPTGWQPIETAPPEDKPVWLFQGDSIWVGTRTYDDGWVYTNCQDTQYFNGVRWTCVDAEFDDDYQPTHWMPLPNPPKEQQ